MADENVSGTPVEAAAPVAAETPTVVEQVKEIAAEKKAEAESVVEKVEAAAVSEFDKLKAEFKALLDRVEHFNLRSPHKL